LRSDSFGSFYFLEFISKPLKEENMHRPVLFLTAGVFFATILLLAAPAQQSAAVPDLLSMAKTAVT
jgi:hypothetical protein